MGCTAQDRNSRGHELLLFAHVSPEDAITGFSSGPSSAPPSPQAGPWLVRAKWCRGFNPRAAASSSSSSHGYFSWESQIHVKLQK